MTKQELKTELNEATQKLLEAISAFTQEQFNVIPFEGSWTAGQVTEHIYKSHAGLPALLFGNKKPAERQPDEREDMLKSIFLDFTTKMKAPDFILPTDGIKDKNDFIKAFRVVQEETNKAQDAVDINLILTDFPFPGIGELTGYEWLVFSTCHIKRHTHQLKNIHAALTTAVAAATN